MHRRLLTILAAVLVGALLSIAVAWRCAVVGEYETDFKPLSSTDATELWGRYVPHHIPTRSVEAGTNHGLGFTWIVLIEEATFEPGIQQYYACKVTRAGWPLRCIEGQQHQYVKDSLGGTHTVGIWVIPDRAYLPRRLVGRAVPLSPRPIGLVVNTVFCSVLAWGMAWLGVRIRCRARLDRDECPRCCDRQYPPYSSQPAPCSECGYCYCHTLHDRPRQVLRLWMVPLLMPQALLICLWSAGLVNWLWLRMQFAFVEPIVTPASIASVVIAMLCLFLIAYSAYSDRPRLQRGLFSAIYGVTISITLYGAVFALVVIARG